jgi:hypothetical protein
MKINKSATSIISARKILALIQVAEDISLGDSVVSISEDGDLLCYNAAFGIHDSETVLYDRLEADSMGDGWESATAAVVIDWLETNC